MDWPTDIAAATAMQQELRHRVRLVDDVGRLQTVAGIDVSYDIASNLTHAFIVTMKLGELKPLVTCHAALPTDFPYVPGYLSFREIPAVLKAFGQLPERPDLLMVDGAGVAHPRRFGIAAHLGVLLDLPAIGVAKSRLIGQHGELGAIKGSAQQLTDRGEVIGTVLRSKDGCNPLYISAGHRLAQHTALELVQRCLTAYRLPEPTRIADKISKQGKEKAPLLV